MTHLVGGQTETPRLIANLSLDASQNPADVILSASERRIMSMIGNLARIPEATRQKLHEHPALIDNFLNPATATTAAQAGSGFLGHLLHRKESAPQELAEHLPEQDVIDIDETWHGLHFLFTGSGWEGEFPQGFLVSCGKPVGDEDVGYGPARSFSPEEVTQIAAFLENVDEQTLRQRLDPKRMAELEIYPTYPGLKPEDVDLEDEWDYLTDSLHRMKEFIGETGANRMALLVYIN
ncbi:MAG: hypothetical protein JWO95_1877 [Verrucomicrobiales bacterium]|nr:hypothetical protein [Verrucomicrobiales bacterium]